MSRFKVQVANAIAQAYEDFVVKHERKPKDLEEFMWFCAGFKNDELSPESPGNPQKGDNSKCTCPMYPMAISKSCLKHNTTGRA